jgi:hypothetical protein
LLILFLFLTGPDPLTHPTRDPLRQFTHGAATRVAVAHFPSLFHSPPAGAHASASLPQSPLPVAICFTPACTLLRVPVPSPSTLPSGARLQPLPDNHTTTPNSLALSTCACSAAAALLPLAANVPPPNPYARPHACSLAPAAHQQPPPVVHVRLAA